jgi:hypothetical protein
VKLTYVSIFYLPLGFCTTLLAINKDYGVTPFAIVAAIVASTTYILVIVANLGNVVLAIKSSWKAIREPIVSRMESDDDNERKNNGNRFKQFRPDRDNIMPSQWLIIQFLLISTLRNLGFFNAKSTNEIQQDLGADKTVEGGDGAGENKSGEGNTEDKQAETGAEVDAITGGVDIAIQGEMTLLFFTSTLSKRS